MSYNSASVPFLLRPAAKDYIWGGRKLKDEYRKNIDVSPLAETWECSTHSDGQSIIADGLYKGLKLGQVLNLHPEYLGLHSRAKGDLPILIKFIDAKEDLSVQVHPDDEYANLYEEGQFGKTEMWYVLSADKDARLVYGFNREIAKKQLKRALEKGDIEKYLHYVPIHKNDVFLIEAGVVHAIGKGTTIVEIQQNSNLTYRLYDYNRKDRFGCKRQLHINKALDVANLKFTGSPRQPMRVLNYRNGYASELLCRCKYFQVNRLLLNTERYRNRANLEIIGDSFHVFLCIEGSGILMGDNVTINFFKGDCIFIPANTEPLSMQGKAQLLNVRC